jgi:hypothetical protein
MAWSLYRKNDALSRYVRPGDAGTPIYDALNTSMVVWIVWMTDVESVVLYATLCGNAERRFFRAAVLLAFDVFDLIPPRERMS